MKGKKTNPQDPQELVTRICNHRKSCNIQKQNISTIWQNAKMKKQTKHLQKLGQAFDYILKPKTQKNMQGSKHKITHNAYKNHL